MKKRFIYYKAKLRNRIKMKQLYYKILFIRYLWEKNYDNNAFHYANQSDEYKNIIQKVELELWMLSDVIKSRPYTWQDRQYFAELTRSIEKHLTTPNPYLNQNEYVPNFIKSFLSDLHWRFLIYSY